MNYHYRPSARGAGYLGSVFLRVICNREVRNITLSWKVYPSEWMGNSGYKIGRWLQVNPLHNRAAKLRRMEGEMERLQLYLRDVVHRLEGEDRPVTANDIVMACRRLSGDVVLWDYTRKITAGMERNGQVRTARAYCSAVRRLCGALENESLTLREITSFLLRRFEDILRREGRSLNTISFYMRNLRAIRNRAIGEGLLENSLLNPFEHVYTGVEQTRKRALSREELRLLRDWDPFSAEPNSRPGQNRIGKAFDAGTQKRLQVSQLYFLFCFYARGMSFVDLAFLRKKDICQGVICYRRKKTGQLLEIKITQQMQQIIRYFVEVTSDSPYIFPIIRCPGINERKQYENALRLQNKYLKLVARKSGMSTVRNSLSTHMARHTWATLAKEARIPLIVISEALGHTSEKTTSIYLNSLDRAYLDEANERVLRSIKSRQ